MKPYITNLVKFSEVADKIGFKRAPNFNTKGYIYLKSYNDTKICVDSLGEISFEQHLKTRSGTEIERLLNLGKDEAMHLLNDIDYLIKFKEDNHDYNARKD